jgi:asparaginyl-tRNA synthetase
LIFSLRIYTFGPTFRAENSNTSRHLAEFWVFEILKPLSLESDINTEFTSFAVLLLWVKMIEPELAFADMNDDMACATAYLQYVVGAFLYHFKIFCVDQRSPSDVFGKGVHLCFWAF